MTRLELFYELQKKSEINNFSFLNEMRDVCKASLTDLYELSYILVKCIIALNITQGFYMNTYYGMPCIILLV